MKKKKPKTIVPQKFQEMYIIMGGNPNYKDNEKLIYNRTTGLLEDSKKTKKQNR